MVALVEAMVVAMAMVVMTLPLCCTYAAAMVQLWCSLAQL